MTSASQRLVSEPENREQHLRVVPVEDRHGLGQFIRVPWSIYADDPVWVPPLIFERRQHLSSRNPFFQHAKYKYWIALRNERPVGRISAQVDRLHLERYQDGTGFFGMLEAEDDGETFGVLLETAETWLRNQGMRRVLGPFNLSINQECGLLVEGFDAPPSVMMGHARPYYGARVEENGYHKEKDLLAYLIGGDLGITPRMRAVMKRAAKRVQIRPLRRSVYLEELQILQDIFEDAWSQNWGFVPFTRAEFEHMGKDLRFLVSDELVQIAEVDDVPAAFIVLMPNINEAIKDLNGKLFPLGWLKLLWRLKVAHPETARVPLMGVRQRYHNSRLGAALALMLIDRVQEPGLRLGVRQVELSWILDNNMGMRNMLDALGGVIYKRYRIYGKELE